MKYSFAVTGYCLSLMMGSIQAAEESVHCAIGHELKAALAGITPGTTLHVSGICYGPIRLTSDDLLLIGSTGDSKTVLQNAPFTAPQEIISIIDASGIWLTGFEIRNGLTGISATDDSSFTLHNIDLVDNTKNMALNNASTQLSNISIVTSNN